MIVFVNGQQIEIHSHARLRDAFLKYCSANGLRYSEEAVARDQWGNEVMHGGPAADNGKYYIPL